MRSRYQGGGVGATVALRPLVFRGPAAAPPAPATDAIFAPTATPTCPPGQHWEDNAPATTLKGIGVCVPDTVKLQPLTFEPPPPATSPGGDRAAAPATVTTATCPPPWSLWWLVVCFAGGAFAGHYVVKNQKAVKKNAGRLANLAATRAVNAGVARLLG